MPLIERMTNQAMKVSPDKKRLKYWEMVFEECKVEGWKEIIKNQGVKNISLKMLRDDWKLNEHLDEIAVILNEAINIYNLTKKLRQIKVELSEMSIEMKEHKLTGKEGEVTYLLLGPSIEEN